MVLELGSQSILLTYDSYNYAGATIGTPTNLVGGAPLSGWTANVDLSTYVYSDFNVQGGLAFDEAVEMPGLSWTTGGEAVWFVQSNEYNVGVSALQSGAAGDYGSSWIETTVQGPGTLTFDWNLLADADDYFSLSVSNFYGEYEELGYYGSESSGWDYREIDLEEGENLLRWTFYNDDPTAGSYDAAFLDNVVLDIAIDYEAEFSIEIERVDQGGSSHYLVFPNLTYSYPAPVTVNEVVSPNGLCSGGDSSSSSLNFATLQDAIDEIEAGDWILYFDRYGSGNEFYFTVSVDALATNDLPVVTITNPAHGATGVSTNTVFTWSGPADFDSASALARHANPGYTIGYSTLPASATTWTNAPPLPEGTNIFSVTYTRESFTGLTISYPADASFNPLYSWATYAELSSLGRSTFQTAAGFAPAPVTLLPPIAGGGNLALSFVSQSGATHFIYSTTNLVSGPWMAATNFPGNGTTNIVTFPATNAAAYFKVETQ